MFSSKNKNEDLPDGLYETTIIAKDLKLNGNIESLKNIRLDGQIEGNVNCQGKIIIGKNGKIKGEIFVQDAEIYGTINGKITVRGVLIIRQGANVQGEVFANNIVSEVGAKFNGTCKMKEINDNSKESYEVDNENFIVEENKEEII